MPMIPTHVRPLRSITAICLLLAGGGCASSSARHVAFTIEAWVEGPLTGRKITTEHYTIYSTLADPELEAVLPDYLEAFYDRYEELFPAPPAEPIHLTTYVFGTRMQWERYTRENYGKRFAVYRRIRAGGFTEGGTSVSFFLFSRGGLLSTLAHEGWHQYVGLRFPRNLPAWLNEGLACYHEAVDFAGENPRFTPQHNTFRINSLREAVQRDELLSLGQIVRTNAGEVISRNHSTITQTYYAQAWALVTFLRHGAGGKYAGGFKRMTQDLADGTFRTRVHATALAGGSGTSFGEAAFVHYFGASPEALAIEYHDHLVRVCGY